MATGLPASQRTREELTSLIEGRLSTGSAGEVATWLIVEERPLSAKPPTRLAEITTRAVVRTREPSKI
jgi:hypothetical protein